MKWIDIIALLLSAIAAIFSIWSFFLERNRERREATIHAFEELEKDVFLDKEYTSVLTDLKSKANEQINNTDQQCGTRFLSKIEHFCVGIQVQAFDISTLNRLAGGYFINQYENWWPIIEKKRSDDGSMKHYNEFEDVVKRLKKKRKTK